MPIGGKVPELDHMFTIEEEVQWSKELAVSALHHTGECSVADAVLLLSNRAVFFFSKFDSKGLG